MKRTERAACFLVPGLAALGLATRAYAAPARHVDLVWERDDPTCLSKADLVKTVEATLGRAVFTAPSAASGRIVATIGHRSAATFGARVVLRSNDGRVITERTIDTVGECRRLDESVAVVVALMIDGLEDAPQPLAVPPDPPRPPPEPKRSGPPALPFSFGLGTGVASSLLPTLAIHGYARAEIEAPRPLGFAIGSRFYGPVQSVLPNGSGGAFTAWTIALSACPAWDASIVRMGGCGGLGVGTIQASAIGLRGAANPLRPLVVVEVLPFLALRLGKYLRLRVETGMEVPLLRDPWGYNDEGGHFVTIYQAASIGFVGALTLELHSGS